MLMQRLATGTLRFTAVLVTIAGLAACGSLGGSRNSAAGQRIAAAPAPAVVPAPQDATITEGVRSQLAREVPLADIDVHTAQGKVELHGTVADAEDARRAVKGALSIEGVRGVVNDLDVAPSESGHASLAASTL